MLRYSGKTQMVLENLAVRVTGERRANFVSGDNVYYLGGGYWRALQVLLPVSKLFGSTFNLEEAGMVMEQSAENVRFVWGICCQCQSTVPVVPKGVSHVFTSEDPEGNFVCIPHSFFDKFCDGSGTEPQALLRQEGGSFDHSVNEVYESDDDEEDESITCLYTRRQCMTYRFMFSELIQVLFENLVGRNNKGSALRLYFETNNHETTVSLIVWAPANYVAVISVKDEGREGESWKVWSYHDSCWRSDGVGRFVRELEDNLSGFDRVCRTYAVVAVSETEQEQYRALARRY